MSKPISLDKQKLLEWLKVEIESCEFIGDERDRTIRLECMKIVERINEGIFDSSPEPVEDNSQRWSDAIENARFMLEEYRKIPSGIFGAMNIANTIARYENGERTEYLLEELESIQ